jgi:membrane-associated phospholipid phosphatase
MRSGTHPRTWRRRALRAALWLCVWATPAGAPAIAQPAPTAPEAREPIHPWEHLDDGLRVSFSGEPLLWYGTAVATTPPLVLWADRPVQDAFQEHDPVGELTGTLALWVGGSVPAALPLGLYVGGLLGEDAELATAGAAALQAGAIQFAFVTSLKWLTDRAGPFPDGDPEAERWHSSVLRDSDDPQAFDVDPFSLRWGLRWPSGHTASSVAMVAALSAFYPDSIWIPLVGYPLALAVGVGMIEGDYHWLSDVTAGALIGHPIGWQVGRQFRRAFDGDGDAGRGGQVQIAFGPGILMLRGTLD